MVNLQDGSLESVGPVPFAACVESETSRWILVERKGVEGWIF